MYTSVFTFFSTENHLRKKGFVWSAHAVCDCDSQSLETAFFFGAVVSGLFFLVSLFILAVSGCKNDSKPAVAIFGGIASLGAVVLLVSSIIIIAEYSIEVGWAWFGIVVGFFSFGFLIRYRESYAPCLSYFVQNMRSIRSAGEPNKPPGYRAARFDIA